MEIYEFLSYGYLNLPESDYIDLIKEKREILKEIKDIDLGFLDEKTLEEHQQDYYDRFFVPSSKVFVPGYESAIRDMKTVNKKLVYGRMDGPYSFNSKIAYEMVGYKPNELNAFHGIKSNPYSDFIGFQLGFLAYLVDQEIRAIKKEDQEEIEAFKRLEGQFIEDHLLPWLGTYRELLEKKQRDLYSCLTELSQSWIEIDREYLEEN